MAYDALSALQGLYGPKDDSGPDPAAGLVPLSSSLIPPIVAQAFGLPQLGGLAPQPQPQAAAPSALQLQSLYGAGGLNPALLGALGQLGGAPSQYPALQQQQFGGLSPNALGYLQALSAAGQQQQQQHHSAAAILAQTAALAAAARNAPAASSQPSDAASQQSTMSGRTAAYDALERGPTTSAATTSTSGPKGPAFSAAFQHPLVHTLYAALAQQQQQQQLQQQQQHYGYAALSPYTSHYPGYYARPDASAAAAAAAAMASAYGYQQAPPAAAAYGAYHPGYGASLAGLASLHEYSALAAAYGRPNALAAAAAATAAPAAPSAGGSQSMGGAATGCEDDYADDGTARAIKRPRLVWTPQLHRKFEHAVIKLGEEKAVPKNIMQEMNIDGLTRENVASHLQKYRMSRRKDSMAGASSADTRMSGGKRSAPEPSQPTAPTPTAGTAAAAKAAPAPAGGPAAAAAPGSSGGGAARSSMTS